MLSENFYYTCDIIINDNEIIVGERNENSYKRSILFGKTIFISFIVFILFNHFITIPKDVPILIFFYILLLLFVLFHNAQKGKAIIDKTNQTISSNMESTNAVNSEAIQLKISDVICVYSTGNIGEASNKNKVPFYLIYALKKGLPLEQLVIFRIAQTDKDEQNLININTINNLGNEIAVFIGCKFVPGKELTKTTIVPYIDNGLFKYKLIEERLEEIVPKPEETIGSILQLLVIIGVSLLFWLFFRFLTDPHYNKNLINMLSTKTKKIEKNIFR